MGACIRKRVVYDMSCKHFQFLVNVEALFPIHAVCCILLVLVFYQLHAPCQSGKGSVGRLSDSGSMDSVQNISQVSWLHLEF